MWRPSISMTHTRSGRPTWFAARPTPGASRIVSVMSSSRWPERPVEAGHGRSPGVRRIGSPSWTMGRMAIGRGQALDRARRVRGPAARAATDEGQVRHVDLEVALRRERPEGGHDGRIVGGQVGLAAAATAVQVAVLGRRQDVELLATVGRVAVADDAELLEDVEGAVHGRGDGARVEGPAAVDQLGAGDVAVGLRQDLDEDPPLRASSAGRARAAGPGRRPRSRGSVVESIRSSVIARSIG